MKSIRLRWPRFALLCVLVFCLAPLRAAASAPTYAHPETGLAATLKPYDDEFNTPALSPQWHWVREAPGDWSLTARPGFMRIMTTSSDMTQGGSNAPLLLEHAPSGDFEVTTNIEIPLVAFQQGGIIIYADDNDFLKCVYDYNGQTGQFVIEFGVEVNGGYNYQQIAAPSARPSTGIFLQIDKSGNTYTGYASADGVHWNAVTSYGVTAFTPSEVGLMAFHGNGTGGASVPADFDFFRERPLAPAISGPLPSSTVLTLSGNQQRLATAVGQYKAALDFAFRQLTGTVGDLGTEGQYFRDEVKSDQFKVYASIAQAAIDTLVAGWDELDANNTTNTAAKVLAVSSDFSLGVAKGATIDAMAKQLIAYLHDHTLNDQAATMVSGINRSIKARIDKQLDTLIANPPNLSKADTDTVIAALGPREDALAWIGTRQVLGAAATLHEVFSRQGSSHVGADLITALWQQATPLVLSALFGPEAGVGAGALISVWNTAVAQQKLAADAQVVAAYELALLSMQDYGARLHDAATAVIKGLEAGSTGLKPASGTLANLQIVDSGAAATLLHRADTRREVLDLSIHNTGATMPFYVLVTYNTGFDINGTLTLGGQQKLHLSVLATLDSFQVGGKGHMRATITVPGGATASVRFTLQDAAKHLDLVPGKGEQLHVGLLAEVKPGDFVLVDSKYVPSDRTVHFPLMPSSHAAGQQPALYVLTGAMLYQQLWIWPHFPASIPVDNHDGFTNLHWTRRSVATATAAGTLYYDLCTKSCAGGPVLQAPVELVASHPIVCTVQVIDMHTFASRLQRAYVYDTLSGHLVHSAGVPSGASGYLQFKPACKGGTP